LSSKHAAKTNDSDARDITELPAEFKSVLT